MEIQANIKNHVTSSKYSSTSWSERLGGMMAARKTMAAVNAFRNFKTRGNSHFPKKERKNGSAFAPDPVSRL